jgi:hypothetical protein
MSPLSLAFCAIYTPMSKYTPQEPINPLFIMSNPRFIQVPRDQDPSPNTAHQSTSYSEQTNAWLREDHKQMPWHNLAYVATSSTQDNSVSMSELITSKDPATQGSAK